MNSIDWLKSVRENDQKPHIPPDPPEGSQAENTVNALIPPVAPCSSVYLNEKEKKLNEGEKEIFWGEETEATSGGHRGKSTNHGAKEGLDVRGIRGNQGNNDISAAATEPAKPVRPFITPRGDLSIPFDSDPKYHWWKPGGQSVKQTRADVLAWMKAEGDNRVV
jgi:hypothetical protein